MKSVEYVAARAEDEHGTPIVAPGTDSGKRCQPACSARRAQLVRFHEFFGRRNRRLHTLGVGLLGAKGRGGIHSGGSSRWQATCGQRDTDDEEGRAGQREWVVTGDAVEQ